MDEEIEAQWISPGLSSGLVSQNPKPTFGHCCSVGAFPRVCAGPGAPAGLETAEFMGQSGAVGNRSAPGRRAEGMSL